MSQISLDHAASLIGVSTATIRNWIKAGHLNPTASRPVLVFESEVIQLKNQIASGQVGRLRARANKIASTERPAVKALRSSSATPVAKDVLNLFVSLQLNISATIYVCAVKVLHISGEVNIEPQNFSVNKSVSAKRSAVEKILSEWRSSFGNIVADCEYKRVFDAVNHMEDDILGKIYQILAEEGVKSNKGAYYTPFEVVRNSIDSANLEAGPFLDPCCGSGRFLIQAARMLKLQPSEIFGFDIDEIAVKIAQINLMLEFIDYDFSPNVFCLDGISELMGDDLFDPKNYLMDNLGFIATNPPWGAYKNTNKAISSKNIYSNESFSLFIEKAICLLKNNGKMSFILPEAVLKMRVHKDVRAFVLKNAKINRIVKLGRVFPEVFTEVIRLDLTKGEADPDWEIVVDSDGRAFNIKQKSFFDNEDFQFNVEVESFDDLIIKKIYSVPHVKLRGNAEWALGIVTGNNAKHVSESWLAGMEPIYRGSDVFNFGLKAPTAFIEFKPSEFQQVAKEHLYRAPVKLIYKFISNSLAFAYDDKQRLTLNSANILIPRIDGISVKVALAFLNSSVFQYLFKKKFSTHKVLRGDLETLPFPIIEPQVNDKIDTLVSKFLESGEGLDDMQLAVALAFGLNEEEIAHIKNSIEG